MSGGTALATGTPARTERFGRAFRLWITAGPGLAWIIVFLIIPRARDQR